MSIEEIKIKYDISEYSEPPITIPDVPESGLVLIVGSSGSGKSTILRSWFEDSSVDFGGNALIENFTDPLRGEELLLACGLRSIPTWFRPYSTLSNGEAHRAYCAKSLDIGAQYIDEFTSVIDRNTAKSLSTSLKKYYDSRGGLLVIATCHRDVEAWLQPDTVYDTDLRSYRARGCLWRPNIELEISPCTVEDWVYFKDHHYLNGEVSKSCHCYIGMINHEPVAFNAIIHGTCRDIRSYWRESRLVVKPSFQGMGIGVAMSEAVAEVYKNAGKRFFSKTAHPALGEHRNRSLKWKGTSTNGICRKSYLQKNGAPRKQKGFGKTESQIMRDYARVCYSHEYIGGCE
jgi:ABC-type ATPase involved in cell division/GNAT superfamily N-acetyltransferase